MLHPREAKGGQWNISEDTEGIEGLRGVWAGGRQSVAVWDGVLYSWGCGGEGRLGLGDPENLEKDVDGDPMASAPRRVLFAMDERSGDETVISVAVGWSMLVAVTNGASGGGVLWAAVPF